VNAKRMQIMFGAKGTDWPCQTAIQNSELALASCLRHRLAPSKPPTPLEAVSDEELRLSSPRVRALKTPLHP